MSDQYYYLLDGKEHGPFSRAAIEQLLNSAQLSGMLLRSAADQPWQAPEELGLHVLRPSDPAALTFRPNREEPQRNSTLAVAGLTALVALVGVGAWGMTYNRGHSDTSENATASLASRALTPPSASEGALSQEEPADEKDTSQKLAERAARAAAEHGDEAAAAAACPSCEPLRKSPTRASSDVCAELVDEVLGPVPTWQGPQGSYSANAVCSNTWQLYSFRVRSLCNEIKGLGSRDPGDGSTTSFALKQAAEDKLDEAYRLGGEYQLKLPRYCR